MSFINRLRQSFGGLSAKASATAGLYPHGPATWLAVGQPHWGSRSYGHLVREGYLRNVIVHRAVRLVAECSASVPIRLYENDRLLDAHPALELLAAPNPMTDGREFLDGIYSYLMLAGNAFIERVDAPGGRPLELHVLRPDRMKIVPGPAGWPEAYEFTVGGRSHRFAVDPVTGASPVLHLRSFHPLDDHHGLGALEAAATGIDLHNATSGWNKALLDNAARPTGALVFEPGGEGPANLTEDQVARLKAEMEAQFQGAANAGRPLLLEGGLKWQPMAFSPADMEFISAKATAAREIALAFGVPPMLLGIPGDNTFANYQEANRALWRLTLLPLVERVLSGLGRFLSAEGSRLRLEADRDALPALAPEREALWARLDAASFLTPNEKRAAVGLEPVAGGDALAPALTPFGDGSGGGRGGEGGDDHPPAGGAPRPFDQGGRLPSAREVKDNPVPEDRPDLDPVIVKIWRTQGDGTVRESHRAADGQIVLEEELFQIGDARLREPRDPEGPPEETINCRCQLERKPVTELQGEERKRAEEIVLAQRRGRRPPRFTPAQQLARDQWFNALRIIRRQNPNDPILSGMQSNRFIPTGEQVAEAREIARIYQTYSLSRHASQRRKERNVPLHSINEAIRKGRKHLGNQPQSVVIELSAFRSSTGRGVQVVINPVTNRVISVLDTGR